MVNSKHALAKWIGLLALLCLANTGSAQSDAVQSLPGSQVAKAPVEVGTVKWGRDLDAAYSSSRSSNKPVLVLFQEVPGCSGCQKFGREVLSHPLLVEAIEDLFEPVVVYNNRSAGTDAELLKRFKEPAWNYQVIRFLNASGQDIVPRKDKIWTVSAVAARMAEALQAAKRPVPKYLQTLAPVPDKANASQVAFAMYCFWTGERHLGKIDGVVATEAGFLDGHEVTLVTYDKSRLPLESLAKKAAQVKCADKVYTADGRLLAGLRGGKLTSSYRSAPSSDQKRQIGRWTALDKVPAINATQRTKINSFAPDSVKLALEWLSPRQRAVLAKVTNK